MKPGLLLALAFVNSSATASTPTPPPPGERGFQLQDWLIVCSLDEEIGRYSGCTMRHYGRPLLIDVHVGTGATRFQLRRDCTRGGNVSIERRGELDQANIAEGLRRAVDEIAAADCSVPGEPEAAAPRRYEPWFYVRANEIYLLMKSF